MNVIDLDKRLARLEADRAPPAVLETSFTPSIRLLCLLVGVHAGNLQPHEAVAEGTARALGYGTGRELRAAMTAERTAFLGWGSQHGEAVEQLLAKHGGGSCAGMERNEAAIRALLSDLPEAFQNHHSVVDMDAAVRLAAEWVSL